MSDRGEVFWSRLRDYLFRVGSCQTRQEFLRTACLEVGPLIPFEHAGIFSAFDLGHLEGTSSIAMAESYNSYYRYRHVFSAIEAKSWRAVPAVVNWKMFDYSEFAVDFMLANGIWKSLQHALPGQPIILTINRSRSSPRFTASDVDALGMVNDYLNNLYSSYDKHGTFDPTPSVEEIGERFHLLSKREAEICSLVARRLSSAEIAACLFINRRTVEKHLEDIFDKLNVHSREQLRWRLGVLPPAGAIHGSSIVEERSKNT